MRILHLVFRLHQAWPLRADSETKKGSYFDGKAQFLEQEKRVYQPFFALLERNVQRNARLKFSLIVSGPWLEQAEEFAPELISRLQDLVETDQVEILVEPYYHSLAFFYDKNEMADQVRLAQERAAELLGAESEVFVYPDLAYNDKIARWAEEFGFVAMLAAGSGVDWRSENHVYEAAECRYLRVLLPNLELTQQIATADSKLLIEQTDKETGERREILSFAKFKKATELAGLRGNLFNLYFDAEIVSAQRGVGVIGFFDELFQQWLKTPGNQFVHAAEACRVERPAAEISVRETTSWRLVQEAEQRRLQSQGKEQDSSAQSGLAKNTEKGLGIYYQVPKCWGESEQIRIEKALYKARGLAIETDEAALIADFGRLTALDYLDTKFDQKRLQTAIADLKQRAEDALTAPKLEEEAEEIVVSRIVKPSVPEMSEPEATATGVAINATGAMSEAAVKREQLDQTVETAAERATEELEGLVRRTKAGAQTTDEALTSEKTLASERLQTTASSETVTARATVESAVPAKNAKKKRRIRLVFE